MRGFCPLASGSKGNCIFFGTDKSKILIDAGLSGRATAARLKQIGVELTQIDAILITHEHTDHILGLKTLAIQLGIPVFANSETAKGIVNAFEVRPRFKIFSTGEPFAFQDLHIHPFSIQHDTLDPVAFTIHVDGIKVGFCTDLGFATSLVHHQLQDCDYLYLEANHQPEMVHASPRPMIYKQRVLGRSGHLSNESCGEILSQVHHSGLKHVHLAHLSSQCNSPETALHVVAEVLKKKGLSVPLSVAPQDTVATAIHF
jgi:phosphoribosyl 1,2-cyclic phosphodiesterase